MLQQASSLDLNRHALDLNQCACSSNDTDTVTKQKQPPNCGGGLDHHREELGSSQNAPSASSPSHAPPFLSPLLHQWKLGPPYYWLPIFNWEELLFQQQQQQQQQLLQQEQQQQHRLTDFAYAHRGDQKLHIGGTASTPQIAITTVNGDVGRTCCDVVTADEDKSPPAKRRREETTEHDSYTVNSPPWLPNGWITEVRTRRTGSTAGIRRKLYKHLASGRRFRTQKEVLRFLQTGKGRVNKKPIYTGIACKSMITSPLLIENGTQPYINTVCDVSNSLSLGFNDNRGVECSTIAVPTTLVAKNTTGQKRHAQETMTEHATKRQKVQLDPLNKSEEKQASRLWRWLQKPGAETNGAQKHKTFRINSDGTAMGAKAKQMQPDQACAETCRQLSIPQMYSKSQREIHPPQNGVKLEEVRAVIVDVNSNTGTQAAPAAIIVGMNTREAIDTAKALSQKHMDLHRGLQGSLQKCAEVSNQIQLFQAQKCAEMGIQIQTLKAQKCAAEREGALGIGVAQRRTYEAQRCGREGGELPIMGVSQKQKLGPQKCSAEEGGSPIIPIMGGSKNQKLGAQNCGREGEGAPIMGVAQKCVREAEGAVTGGVLTPRLPALEGAPMGVAQVQTLEAQNGATLVEGASTLGGAQKQPRRCARVRQAARMQGTHQNEAGQGSSDTEPKRGSPKEKALMKAAQTVLHTDAMQQVGEVAAQAWAEAAPALLQAAHRDVQSSTELVPCSKLASAHQRRPVEESFQLGRVQTAELGGTQSVASALVSDLGAAQARLQAGYVFAEAGRTERRSGSEISAAQVGWEIQAAFGVVGAAQETRATRAERRAVLRGRPRSDSNSNNRFSVLNPKLDLSGLKPGITSRQRAKLVQKLKAKHAKQLLAVLGRKICRKLLSDGGFVSLPRQF